MNHEVPDFQSDIPAHLLTNASPQDKYIMENISILGQKSNWLTETQKKQSEALEDLKKEVGEVKVQTTKTNGSVVVLKQQAKDAEGVVGFYKKTAGFVSSKMGILAIFFGFTVFFTYVAPWLAANGKSLIPAIVKIFFGT